MKKIKRFFNISCQKLHGFLLFWPKKTQIYGEKKMERSFCHCQALENKV
jgi:hypothetical protein